MVFPLPLRGLVWLACVVSFPSLAFAGKAAIQLGNDETSTPYLDATKSYAGTATASAMLFRMNGTERMRLTASGNVGIGTAAPTERLDLGGGNIGMRYE